MEEIPEIRVKKSYSFIKLINLAEQLLYTKEKINLVAGTNCSPMSVDVSEDLVRLGYATIENIQTLTKIQNYKRFVNLIITLKRTKDFKNIFEKDIITIIYKPTKGFKTRIFGEIFANNHQYECNIIYKNKIHKLTEFFDDIEENYNHDDLITIKLRGINNIKNINWMFCKCYSLISLSDISKWNTSQVKDMCCMFYKCHSLISLPDISKWDTSNVEILTGMFNYCISLISLPDISKWNTSKVKNMSYMFSGCESLSSLPDISKWNTSNVEEINDMFFWCKSLTSLPDISRWNTSNVRSMNDMFTYCYSLISLPDVSIWNISKVTNKQSTFFDCLNCLNKKLLISRIYKKAAAH